MAGRPKEFDKQEALAKAMDVFWTHGYEAASVQDLLDAMGINRGSMYDTFGDKHALFTAAYDHYAANVATQIAETLDGPGSPLANIRKILRRMADPAGDGRRRGCLCTNSVVELAPHDAQVAGAVKSSLAFVEKSFERTLKRAIAEGELPRRADTRALARFLACTVQGVVVMGKAGAGRAAVGDAIDVAMTTLA